MSNTQQKQQPLEEAQLSDEALNLKSNSQLIEREPLEGTPFEMLKEEGKYYLTWGQYKLTEAAEHRGQIYEQMDGDRWLIISRMMFAILHMRDMAKQ